MKVLGIEVDEVDRQEAVDKISAWVKPAFAKSFGRIKHVVTIYSEFFLTAEKDSEFRKAVENADLVVPDGMGVLASLRFSQKISNFKFQISNKSQFSNFKFQIIKIWLGLGVGLKGLKGQLGEPVTGVWLFEELVRVAALNDWKVFLLGGFNSVAKDLATKLQISNIKLQIESDAGEPRLTFAKAKLGRVNKENERVIKKINEFKPDLLMVAYGPVTQEKWIYENKKKLKAKVVIGLGGTFDEVLGNFPKAPKWMEKRGLKALWRLMVQPKRLPRIFRAMVIFPWRVFRQTLECRD